MSAVTWQEELRGNIRTVLADRGIRMSHCAREIGMKPTDFLNRMHQQWFHPSEVAAVADYLDLSADELLGDSVYRGDPKIREHQQAERRRQWDELQAAHERRKQERLELRKDGRRALCCVCGTMRLVAAKTTANMTVFDDVTAPRDQFRGRMLGDWKCETCGEVTEHAVLRDTCLAEHADLAEVRVPSAEDKASKELAALKDRLVGFGVHVTDREVNDRRVAHWIKKGDVPSVGVEFDLSKDQWRIELHPGMPALMMLDTLKKVAAAIITDGVESEEWICREGQDPRESITTGIHWTPTSKLYAPVVDDILDQLPRQAAIVKQQMVLDVRDTTNGEVSA